MIPTTNRISRKPPAHEPQIAHSKRNCSRETKRLICGHALRLILRGDPREDISDQVADILGTPRALTEEVCNKYIRELALRDLRWTNGIKNTISHVNAVEADLEERVA